MVVNQATSNMDAEKKERERQVFKQITRSLAGRYDILYYVDLISGVYTQLTSADIYGDDIEVPETGSDFFAESRENAKQILHPEDMDRILGVLDKDYLITKLDAKKEFSADYRLIVNGKPQHTRLSVMWSYDHRHFVIGVENIEAEVRKKSEQNRVLKMANEIARRDDLTGVKNKTAFNEFLRAIQRTLDRGTNLPLAFVVCDLNDLKRVNDTMGHAKGDDHLIRACRMICKVFSHSPVFRIGGDEFVTVLMRRDYASREGLLELFRRQVLEHQKNKDGPVIAVGMAEYDPEHYDVVAAALERADQRMYEDKNRLKNGSDADEDSAEAVGRIIPADRKKRMDQLFGALSITAEEAYVFLCDMRYDYSRWAQAAVDYFDMPSEYMYDAGYIWKEHIHPEDRETYHKAMDGIFYGSSTSHDMMYRARNKDGEYIPCTCLGTVLRDRNGEAEYFCGSIINHGVQHSIDTVTGLRNQYGFLEDLQGRLDRATSMQLLMVGISRFSELNDVYGYHFGNRLLQQFGRYIYDLVGGKGKVYRLDGTKFAVMSANSDEKSIREKYDALRMQFRDGFYVEDKYVILEVNGGLLIVDDADIDSRTAYSCLNYVYNVSKYQKRGDLTLFHDQLSDENEKRIQKIQAIRASITQRFRGYFLAYQPVVSAKDGRLIGAEALIRWQDTKYGLVPPDEFIPVMEKDSLFPELGRWILRTALTDAKKMLRTHPDFIIDVNLAYTQLEQPGFVDEVIAILKEVGFPANQVCLEITERCRLLDIELLNNVVVGLRAKGVQISLDDFGTGFSSVGIVKELPMDVIKIDRSFIRDIEEDDRARALIDAFTTTASLYGARVCAEGVENEAMCEILRKYPVDSFQGFLYSKPLAFVDFRQWVTEHELSLSDASEAPNR